MESALENGVKKRPITVSERSSEHTMEMDVAQVDEAVRMIRAADLQLFDGFHGHESVLDTAMLRRLAQLGHALRQAVCSPTGGVVFAGSGTSGRLAFALSRRLGAAMSGRAWYLNSGGDGALLLPKERAEDDPHAAVADLKSVCPVDPTQVRPLVVVGISCGMSAPYVAGLLDWALRNDNCIPVLLGFSPVEWARDVPIEGWSRSFRDVALEMDRRMRECQDKETGNKVVETPAIVLSPVLGPEPLTGSTRMKGGSATWLLLCAAIHLAIHSSFAASPLLVVQSILEHYQQVARTVYAGLQSSWFQSLVETAGRALRNGGHLYYLGRGDEGFFGVVDASECPPTFGARPTDVRGFVDGGWSALRNRDGDLTALGPLYALSRSDFERDVRPGLRAGLDVVVVLHGHRPGLDNRSAAEADYALVGPNSAHCWLVDLYPDGTVASSGNGPPDVEMKPHWGIQPQFMSEDRDPGTLEYVFKLFLNTLSTLAHVRCGKVLNNRMIDLRVSNAKLYMRAVGIVRDFAGVTEAEAEDSLLASIYGRRGHGMAGRAVSGHVAAAVDRARVIPRAILLARAPSRSPEEADQVLDKHPVVRDAVTHVAC